MEEHVLTIDLEGNGIINPLFCEYPSGRNWGAILKGTNAANMTRTFLAKYDETIDMSDVEIGDVVEVAGDCVQDNGRRIRDRQYWLIIYKTDEDGKIFYRSYETPAKALKAGREFASASPKKADDSVAADDGVVSAVEEQLLAAA